MATATDTAIRISEKYGLYAFPVRPYGSVDADGRPTDKAPAITRPAEKCTAYTPDVMRAYADAHPATNWGIMPGPTRSGMYLTVIDCDTKKGKDGHGALAAMELNEGALPRSLTVHTPSGGAHIYLLTESPLPGGTELLGAGLDVQSGPQYVLAPGSSVADNAAHGQAGGEYRMTHEPDAIAHMPPAWVAAIRSRAAPAPVEVREAPPGLELDQPEDLARAREYLRGESPAVEGEGGDAKTFKVCARVKDFGLTIETALELLGAEWNPRCAPPWDIVELDRKLRHAWRYGQNDPGCDSEQARANELEADFRIPPGEWSKYVEPVFSVWESDPKPPKPIIQGLVCPGTVNAIFGKSKTMKSFLTMQLGACLSSGSSFFGFDVPSPVPATYLQLEISATSARLRLAGMVSALFPGLAFGAPNPVPGYDVLNLRGKRLQPADLLAIVDDLGVRCLIIDPIYKLTNGGEASEDIKPLLDILDAIAAKGVAVVYVHHDKKGVSGDSVGVDRGSGHGIISRHYDTAILIDNHARIEGARVLSFICRDFVSPDPITIEFRDGAFFASREAPEIETTASRKKKLDHQQSPAYLTQARVMLMELSAASGGQGVAKRDFKRHIIETLCLSHRKADMLIDEVLEGAEFEEINGDYGKKFLGVKCSLL